MLVCNRLLPKGAGPNSDLAEWIEIPVIDEEDVEDESAEKEGKKAEGSNSESSGEETESDEDEIELEEEEAEVVSGEIETENEQRFSQHLVFSEAGNLDSIVFSDLIFSHPVSMLRTIVILKG
ncbi:hypothetical protein U1Q18_012199 [Sarracenia purpurea var. burkii]